MTGPLAPDDDVIVNVEAADLGLGSGGFDIVHAGPLRERRRATGCARHEAQLHLASACGRAGRGGARGASSGRWRCRSGCWRYTGSLRCAAFALAQLAPGARVGYVQTSGGALPGALSDVVAELLDAA